MRIVQLSVFMENRVGHLSQVCQTLADCDINILALALADTSEFGILRLIVHRWEKAKAALEQANCTVNTVEVMALEVPDRPGGMEHILQVAEKAKLGIDYMYAFTLKRNENAVLIIRFSDLECAVAVFRDADVHVIDATEFYG